MESLTQEQSANSEVQEKLLALAVANAHSVDLTEEMVTLANVNFENIVASQEEEARKAVIKEAKDQYQENKDAITEITTIIDAMETEQTDLETKKANTTSNRQIANYNEQLGALDTAITDAKTAKAALQSEVTTYETAKAEEENAGINAAIAQKE